MEEKKVRIEYKIQRENDELKISLELEEKDALKIFQKLLSTYQKKADNFSLEIKEEKESKKKKEDADKAKKEDSEKEEETKEEAEAEEKTDNYILPDSSKRILADSEVSGLSKSELRLARNEIFARHGRMFDDQELQDYFNSKSWYRGTIRPEDFSESMLSETEKANIETIKKYE